MTWRDVIAGISLTGMLGLAVTFGIYKNKVDTAVEKTAQLEAGAEQLDRDAAQWRRIAELNTSISDLRERMAAMEAHH
jgi:hypothetical protein